MISTAETKAENFQEALSKDTFVIEAPRTNPLVASSPLSFVRPREGALELHREEVPVADVTVKDTEALLSTMIRAARERVERFPKSSQAHANLGAILAKNQEN